MLWPQFKEQRPHVVMKIVLLTAGTRGDTQPFIALGVALQRLGAEVSVAAGENFSDLVSTYGLGYEKVHINIEEFLAQGEGDDSMKAKGPIQMLRSLDRPDLKEKTLSMQRDYSRACTDADAIVYHPGGAVAHFIAQEHGIPSFLGLPFPMTVTNEYPAILLYDSWWLPSFLNRLSHRLFHTGFWMAISKPIALYLQEKHEDNGTQNYSSLPNPFAVDDHKLVSCSNHVFKTPSPAVCYGYWFLDEPKDYQPSRELQQFLVNSDCNHRPIYIGFGSVGSAAEATQKTQVILQAIGKTGHRAIIATGYGGLAAANNDNHKILFIEKAPHAWLFPRVSLVIHHGGAGTTAAGLRAGVPSLIVPHGNDQFAWGKRVKKLGVGARLHRLTTQALVKGIEEALQPDVVEAARVLGEKIRAERGAERMAEHLWCVLGGEEKR